MTPSAISLLPAVALVTQGTVVLVSPFLPATPGPVPVQHAGPSGVGHGPACHLGLDDLLREVAHGVGQPAFQALGEVADGLRQGAWGHSMRPAVRGDRHSAGRGHSSLRARGTRHRWPLASALGSSSSQSYFLMDKKQHNETWGFSSAA